MEFLARKRKWARRIAAGAFALTALSGSLWSARAQDAKKRYPRMAPIEQYLMERNAEITLAKSGAPASISKDATILILERHGFETAVKGTNGFVCIVERGWTQGIDFPEVWNPKIKGADCFNPPAARSVLSITLMKTRMTLAGDSEKEIIAGFKEAFSKKELPALEPGAMSYMMGAGSYLTDDGNHNMPHLMFFMPLSKDSDWGAKLAGSPVGAVFYWFPGDDGNPLAKGLPTLRVFTVTVRKWSDGTTDFRGH